MIYFLRVFFYRKEKEGIAKDISFPVFGGKLFSLFSFIRPKTGIAISLYTPSCIPHSGLPIFDPYGIHSLPMFVLSQTFFIPPLYFWLYTLIHRNRKSFPDFRMADFPACGTGFFGKKEDNYRKQQYKKGEKIGEGFFFPIGPKTY